MIHAHRYELMHSFQASGTLYGCAARSRAVEIVLSCEKVGPVEE